jgi:coproporphyrinogen III oxidase
MQNVWRRQSGFFLWTSLVLHPRINGATVHANWRYFENVMITESNSTMVWWRTRFNLIICLKKMQFIFIKRVKPLATNTILIFIKI